MLRSKKAVERLCEPKEASNCAKLFGHTLQSWQKPNFLKMAPTPFIVAIFCCLPLALRPVSPTSPVRQVGTYISACIHRYHVQGALVDRRLRLWSEIVVNIETESRRRRAMAAGRKAGLGLSPWRLWVRPVRIGFVPRWVYSLHRKRRFCEGEAFRLHTEGAL